MKVKILLVLIIALSLLARVYRISELLGFYFDQGRDASVIWELWHSHRFFLIGPTTGIEGIFRGPWYYWLISLPYLIGRGNPIWPSVFLSITSVIAVVMCFCLGKKIQGPKTGLLAALISGLSFYIVQSSRWLSNPTPMLLISMLLVYFMFAVQDGKKWAWVGIAFLLGMAMQFGSSTEVFFFPALFIFFVWQFKNRPNLKQLIVAAFAFFITILPQAFFDFRHDRILSRNILNFLFEKGSFQTSFIDVLKIRLSFYYEVYFSKLFPTNIKVGYVFGLLALFSLVISWKKIHPKVWTIILLLMSVSVGMVFFHGNYGNVYDYYFTGSYLLFILVFSYSISIFPNKKIGLIIYLLFAAFFIRQNVPLIKSYTTSGIDGPTTIAFGNQKMAIDWIYKDTVGRDFNVDVYVPPVIPHAYDYLFTWIGNTKYHKLPKTEQISNLYLLYEQDPPHPERLKAWMIRQNTYAWVDATATFGGITVERRIRFPAKQ